MLPKVQSFGLAISSTHGAGVRTSRRTCARTFTSQDIGTILTTTVINCHACNHCSLSSKRISEEFLCLDWPLHSGPLCLRHRGLAVAAYLQEPPFEFRCQQCPAFVFFSRFSHSSSKNPYRISGSTNIIYLHSCHSTCTLSKHTTCTTTRLLWPAFTGRAHHTPLQIMLKDLSKRTQN